MGFLRSEGIERTVLRRLYGYWVVWMRIIPQWLDPKSPEMRLLALLHGNGFTNLDPEGVQEMAGRIVDLSLVL